MQSVTSNAVASLMNSSLDDNNLVDITNSVTKYLGVEMVRAYRRHNICYLYFSGTYSGSPTTSTQTIITGLPAKYQPKFDQSVVFGAYNNNQYAIMSRGLITDDLVQIGESSWINGTQMRCGFMYFAKD